MVNLNQFTMLMTLQHALQRSICFPPFPRHGFRIATRGLHNPKNMKLKAQNKIEQELQALGFNERALGFAKLLVRGNSSDAKFVVKEIG